MPKGIYKRNGNGACINCGAGIRKDYRYCSAPVCRRVGGAASARAHYAANREEIRVLRNAQYAANPDYDIFRRRASRAADPDKFRARDRALYAADPEKVRAQKRAQRAANSEKYLARMRAHNAARTAAKLRAIPKWADQENELIGLLYVKSGQYGLTVDHVVPLKSKFVCGLHCWHNLQLLSGSENSSKGNHRWPDMADA